MRDDEIRASFDGRGRVVLLPGQVTRDSLNRIAEIARALGYRQLTLDGTGRGMVRIEYERDDSPVARRQAGLTIDRLREGMPLLPLVQPAAPPPPGPPPPAPTHPQPPRPRRLLPSEPPPPPTVVAPARPRIPPRPLVPPPPTPPPPLNADGPPNSSTE